MAYSRYGHLGKGLTDRGERKYAAKLSKKYGSSSNILRDYVTFVDKKGVRKASGTFQALGMTAASMGFGTGMQGYQVTGDTGLSGYEFLAKYYHAGNTPTGNKLYLPYGGGGIPQPSMPGAKSSAQGIQGMTTGFGTGIGYGNIPSGVSPPGGSGMANWMRSMFGGNRYGKPKPVIEEEPVVSKKVITLGAIGLLVWKVLL